MGPPVHPMFRPVRTLFLIGLAFVGGVFFERNAAREACLAGGATWDSARCYGLERTNG